MPALPNSPIIVNNDSTDPVTDLCVNTYIRDRVFIYNSALLGNPSFIFSKLH